MTEETRITPEEIKRREAYLMDGLIPYNILDPFSWSFPARFAFAAGIIAGGSWCFNNVVYRRPWYAGFMVKGSACLGGVIFAYYLGKYRVWNMATRDAVIDHYMSLHPEDFKHTADFNGRPYRDILLPWIPVRPRYLEADDDAEQSR